MLLSDVDALLNTSYVGSSNEAVYEARLDAAKDQTKKYCNNEFLVEQDDGTYKEVIPKGAQMGIALMVKSMGESQNVSSQALGDMSKSFFKGGTYKSALGYLKPYRKVGFK